MSPRYIYVNAPLCLLLLLLSSHSFAAPVKILVSIKPLHSLVSHITQGINKPELLLNKQQSPHHFQLRPSQKRQLNQADIFIYSSDSFESFIPALKNTQDHLQFIPLTDLANINKLPARSLHEHHHGDIDGHIWLSIYNAQKIALYVTQMLSKLDPANALQYQYNFNSLNIKLEALKQSNYSLLNPFRNKAFLVYHDAYQYFEQENKLTNAFFVTINPDHSPGIKRVKELKELITSHNIQCIFYEPPNIPSLLNTLTEKSSRKLTALDPLGTHIEPGLLHYFKLMQQTAISLHACISQP